MVAGSVSVGMIGVSRIFPKIPQRFGAVVVVKFDGGAIELDTDGQRRQIGGVD